MAREGFAYPGNLPEHAQEAVVRLVAEHGQVSTIPFQYAPCRGQQRGEIVRTCLDPISFYKEAVSFTGNLPHGVEQFHVGMAQAGVAAEDEKVARSLQVAVCKVEGFEAFKFVVQQRAAFLGFSAHVLETGVGAFVEQALAHGLVDIGLDSFVVIVQGGLFAVRPRFPEPTVESGDVFRGEVVDGLHASGIAQGIERDEMGAARGIPDAALVHFGNGELVKVGFPLVAHRLDFCGNGGRRHHAPTPDHVGDEVLAFFHGIVEPAVDFAPVVVVDDDAVLFVPLPGKEADVRRHVLFRASAQPNEQLHLAGLFSCGCLLSVKYR